MRDFLIRDVDSLNLSAPGAAKFEKPLALSYKSLSKEDAVTSSSVISSPILYEGVLEY